VSEPTLIALGFLAIVLVCFGILLLGNWVESKEKAEAARKKRGRNK